MKALRLSGVISLTVIAGLAYPAIDAVAHHAATMFDRERTVELVGTIREFQWTNPHVWIQIQVPTADGESEEWSVEGGVPSRLFRSGWRPNSFEPGDEVTIRAYPMGDGGKAGLFIGAKLSDGTTLGRYD